MALAACFSHPARAASAPAVLPAPGVAPHEVVVGSILDLTGPLAAQGLAIRNGLTIAFDEINAHGGVNGRKIRLLARDSAYDPEKARKAAQELLTKGIFAMIGSDGTPPVSATMTMVLNAGVLHLFAFVPAHTAYAPGQPLSFAMELPVAAQVGIGVKALLDQRGPLRIGVLYRADEYGRAALKGTAEELARRGMTMTDAEQYTPGAPDLRPQLRAMRAAGVELVVLGAVAQESFQALAQAHRSRWYPVFLCPAGCYVPEAATLGGSAVEGLYSVATTPIPYPDLGDAKLRKWINGYERRFQAFASSEALLAYLDGKLFAEALRRSGAHPTQLYFSRQLEAMPPWSIPGYGAVPVDYSAADHSGQHSAYLTEIMRGRWHLVSEALAIPSQNDP
jgi:ABC-type branched-subunit amino acid transport system substrate-binding protein